MNCVFSNAKPPSVSIAHTASLSPTTQSVVLPSSLIAVRVVFTAIAKPTSSICSVGRAGLLSTSLAHATKPKATAVNKANRLKIFIENLSIIILNRDKDRLNFLIVEINSTNRPICSIDSDVDTKEITSDPEVWSKLRGHSPKTLVFWFFS